MKDDVESARVRGLCKYLGTDPSYSGYLLKRIPPCNNIHLILHPQHKSLLDPTIFAYILLDAFGCGVTIQLSVQQRGCLKEETGYAPFWTKLMVNARATLIYKHCSDGPGFRHDGENIGRDDKEAEIGESDGSGSGGSAESDGARSGVAAVERDIEMLAVGVLEAQAAYHASNPSQIAEETGDAATGELLQG